MVMVLRRPSSALLKKKSSVKKVPGWVQNVNVCGQRYKVPKWMTKQEALRKLKISVSGRGVKEIFCDQTVIENYHAASPCVYGTLECGMRVKIEVKPNGCKADWVQNFDDEINMMKLLDLVNKAKIKKAALQKAALQKKLSKIKKAALQKKLKASKAAAVALKYLTKVEKEKSLKK
jgi:hypothetical protein